MSATLTGEPRPDTPAEEPLSAEAPAPQPVDAGVVAARRKTYGVVDGQDDPARALQRARSLYRDYADPM